jgi:hypothetical protein
VRTLARFVVRVDRRSKKLFAPSIDDFALDRLPGGLTAQWQVVRPRGEPVKTVI